MFLKSIQLKGKGCPMKKKQKPGYKLLLFVVCTATCPTPTVAVHSGLRPDLLFLYLNPVIACSTACKCAILYGNTIAGPGFVSHAGLTFGTHLIFRDQAVELGDKLVWRSGNKSLDNQFMGAWYCCRHLYCPSL